MELINEYKSWNEKTLIKCKKCNHIWNMAIGKIKGCRVCSTGKNEKLTGKYLKEIFPNKKINQQHTVFYTFYLKKRRFIIDYSLTINGQLWFIEYNGQQHYKPTKFCSKMSSQKVKEKFKLQQKRDNRLRKYCKNNNIQIIEINGLLYKDKKIKTYLENKFCKLKKTF